MFRVTVYRYENETKSRNFREYSDAVEYLQKFLGKGYTGEIEHI